MDKKALTNPLSVLSQYSQFRGQPSPSSAITDDYRVSLQQIETDGTHHGSGKPRAPGVEPGFTLHKPPKAYTAHSLAPTFNPLQSQPPTCIQNRNNPTNLNHYRNHSTSHDHITSFQTNSTQTRFQPHPPQQLKSLPTSPPSNV